MLEQIEENSTRIFAQKKLAQHLAVASDQITLEEKERDLSHDGKRYDIKLSNPVFTQKEKKVKVWDFDLRGNSWRDGRNRKAVKEVQTCDFYILIGMQKDVPEKVFLVPASLAPSSHVRISLEGKSKYHQYAI